MDNQDNKNKILNIALEMFTNQGYDAVGVQALCQASGVSKPTLYYYFGNKEGVLNEVLKSNYEKLNNLLKQNAQYQPNPDIYEKDVFFTLTNVAECYLNFSKNNDKFSKMVLNATFAPNEGTLSKMAFELNQVQYEIIENMFSSMSKIHRNMQGSEKRLAWSFIGLINTYIALKTEDSIKSFIKQFMQDRKSVV